VISIAVISCIFHATHPTPSGRLEILGHRLESWTAIFLTTMVAPSVPGFSSVRRIQNTETFRARRAEIDGYLLSKRLRYF
jgi:hypothetical protein